MKKLANNYARLTNHNIFKYQTLFSTRLQKQDEYDHVIDEIEFSVNLNINHNLSYSDIDNNVVRSHLEHRIQIKNQRLVDEDLINLFH